MEPKHQAIAAGLALTLAFGSVAAPAPVFAETTPGTASSATNVDKSLYTQQSLAGAVRSVGGITPRSLSGEMKYFTKYESHGNYDQGFSNGDGYNALGYYQFDRTSSLVSFMRQVYQYNPTKYAMFKPVIDRGSELSNRNTKIHTSAGFTEIGQLAENAWHAAYAADPTEFSALQDGYAYSNYYQISENWLKSKLGIDISGRADCVKGMVWSVTNLCGTGGCQYFFNRAGFNNGMSDREFVTALSNSVINNIKSFSSQAQYYNGWINRYKNELKDCLVYISEDEAEAKAAADAEAAQKKAEAEAAAKAEADKKAAEEQAKAEAAAKAEAEKKAAEEKAKAEAAEKAEADKKADADKKAEDASKSEQVSNSNQASSDSKSDSKNDESNSALNDSVPSDDADSRDNDVVAAAPTQKTEEKSDKGSGGKKGESDNEAKTGSSNSDDKANDESDAWEKKGKNQDRPKDDDSTKKPETPQQQKETTVNQTSNKTVAKSTNTVSGMPKTGDLIVMAGLASASLAAFGATAFATGAHGLKRNKDDENSENE